MNDIKSFNSLLGKEKSYAMNQAIVSFEHFLNVNYPESNTQSDRIKSFLEQLSNDYQSESDVSLIYETTNNMRIINLWEKSGLRKEIWTYGYENYEPTHNIEDLLIKQKKDSITTLGEAFLTQEEDESWNIDVDSLDIIKEQKEMEKRMQNTLHANSSGDFLYGLAKYSPNDKIIQDYVDAKFQAGDIFPILFLPSFLEKTKNFNETFFKMIIITEFYYPLIKEDIEQNS